jgi:hypothetical protein
MKMPAASGFAAVTAGAIGIMSLGVMFLLWSTGVVRPTHGEFLVLSVSAICGVVAVALGIARSHAIAGKAAIVMGSLSLSCVGVLVCYPGNLECRGSRLTPPRDRGQPVVLERNLEGSPQRLPRTMPAASSMGSGGEAEAAREGTE